MTGRAEKLAQSNQARMADLAAQGVQIGGVELLVRDVFLEHILRQVGGDEAVLDCRYDIETQIAAQLDQAESQLPAARQARTAQLLGVGPRSAR